MADGFNQGTRLTHTICPPNALRTQPNERRCQKTIQRQTLDLPRCCPRSGNPQTGSFITIEYTPGAYHLEVASLYKYIQSYVGGRGDVRSMEGMVQQITQDCADVLGVPVTVRAFLRLDPPQVMTLTCKA